MINWKTKKKATEAEVRQKVHKLCTQFLDQDLHEQGDKVTIMTLHRTPCLKTELENLVISRLKLNRFAIFFNFINRDNFVSNLI